MRFLADENFLKPVIDWLRLERHDLLWAGTDFPSSEDKWVLDRQKTKVEFCSPSIGIFGIWQYSGGNSSADLASSCFESIRQLPNEWKHSSVGFWIWRIPGSAESLS